MICPSCGRGGRQSSPGGEALSYQQMWFARRCVARWMSIYHENLGRMPSAVDADHSGLLPWLFSGGEPLPEPLKHGEDYPWPNWKPGFQRPVNAHQTTPGVVNLTIRT